MIKSNTHQARRARHRHRRRCSPPASAAAPTGPAAAQPAGAVAPANDVTLSVGTGRMVRLAAPCPTCSSPTTAIADVQVRSPNQIYMFGKAAGETTVYATDAGGQVVCSANVRVGKNIGSIDADAGAGDARSATSPRRR